MANSNYRTLTVDTIDGVLAAPNYIKNSSARQNVKGYATYADAAGTAPVDGTGGSPTVTWTRTTSSPLALDASFLFTKDAANRQGQGASYDFTINREDLAKPLAINFSYEVASGTYADGDLTVWIYDVTNGGSPIQPDAYNILNAVGPQKKQTMTFQTASNSTSYRLIIHCASTSAVAYTVKFDSISVGPQVVPMGAAITDWQAYTPVASTTTNATTTGVWRRVGDSLEGRVRTVFSGANTQAIYTVAIPTGLSMDNNKLTAGAGPLGLAYYYDQSGSFSGKLIGFVEQATATTLRIVGIDPLSTQVHYGRLTDTSSGVPLVVASPDAIELEFKVPILGWGSSTIVSDSAETRVVAAKATLSGNQTVSSSAITKVTFNQTDFNTDGAFDTTNNRFIVKTPGIYDVAGSLRLAGVNTAEFFSIYIYKNGSNVYRMDEYTDTTSVFLEGGSSFSAIAGDYFEIHVQSSGDASYTVEASLSSTVATFSKKSGPAQIAASEVIMVDAYGPSSTHSASAADMTGWIEIHDTHGAFDASTGTFTAPAPGYYHYNATYGPQNTGTPASIFVRKNNAAYTGARRGSAYSNGSVFPNPVVFGTMWLNAGETIKFQAQNSSGSAVTTDSSNTFMTIHRLGGIG